MNYLSFFVVDTVRLKVLVPGYESEDADTCPVLKEGYQSILSRRPKSVFCMEIFS